MPGGVGLLFVVGQVALASITDPSGQVLVVGDVVDGVNDCVQDGSVGFFVQSTGGGVPVQLYTHVDRVPEPPDDANDFVVLTYGHVVLSLHVDGGGGGVIPMFICITYVAVLSFEIFIKICYGITIGTFTFQSFSHFPVIGLYTCPG